MSLVLALDQGTTSSRAILFDRAGSIVAVAQREFRQIATPAQRAQLLECLFAVAASDGEISVTERHEGLAIAEELGFTRPQALGVRSGFREHLAELRRRS